MSPDDKALIPLGIPAAVKQQKIMMHFSAPVRLADHTFPVAPGYKLKPSIYVGVLIKENEPGRESAVGYSGPTAFRVRNCKYSSVTAFRHMKAWLSHTANLPRRSNTI